VTNFIDDLFEEKFAQETLGFPAEVKLGLDKFSIGGHSFGGMTAIAVSNQDSRVKATFGMDPWVWAITEKVDAQEYEVKQPQLYIVSEGFPAEVQKVFEFDTIDYLKKIQDTCESDKKELIIVKDTNHFH
jgi:pimeloyl-ACP methyl ester carboxylesterase